MPDDRVIDWTHDIGKFRHGTIRFHFFFVKTFLILDIKEIAYDAKIDTIVQITTQRNFTRQ